jgi:predicted transcriptional regulator
MGIKRRGRMDIIADILRSIQEKGGKIKPTHLLYKSNLSHVKLKEYLSALSDKGMIEETILKGRKYIFMKEQGHKFLLEYDRIKEFSDSFGL